MTAIDAPTLLLLLAGGLYLGLLGFFNIDLVVWLVGEQYKSHFYQAVGLAAAWQFCRQPWWHASE